jgi:hypothetical protein
MLLSNLTDRITARKLTVACLLWIVLFVLYLPAAEAGFVSDTTGWIQSIERDSFWEYINRTHFGVKSMYQLTQFNTWVLYQLLGKHQWGWHLVHVTLHTLNCLLLYAFSLRLFRNAGLQQAARPAFAGVFLFAISPYISEVVVWEASFHYLQALLLIFSILILTQRFQETPAARYAIVAGVLFFLSTFTLELFYLTPFFILSLAFYYRTALHYKKELFAKTALYFTLPQVLMFVLHLLLFRMVYGGGVAHLGTQLFKHPPGYFLVKAPWYVFHLSLWGRFFPNEARQAVYNVFRTPAGSVTFYTVLGALCLFIAYRYRRMSAYGKLISLYFSWLLAGLAILAPLFFMELLLVVCDRYMYLILAFYWMLASLLLYRLMRPALFYGAIALCAMINGYFALKMSWKWGQSAAVVAAIQQSPVLKPGKVKLLLNSPACLQGIPMIGTSPEGEYRLMHNLFFPSPINDTMLEVAAYNMDWKNDGAHTEVLNDSTVRVTLNQWGTWWWIGGFGATSYENNWVRLDMVDAGHMYEVILKKPAEKYQLLYHKGNELKEVDMTLKGEQY